MKNTTVNVKTKKKKQLKKQKTLKKSKTKKPMQLNEDKLIAKDEVGSQSKSILDDGSLDILADKGKSSEGGAMQN